MTFPQPMSSAGCIPSGSRDALLSVDTYQPVRDALASTKKPTTC